MTSQTGKSSRRWQRALVAVALGVFYASLATAATVTVTTLADENNGCAVGLCSLREALAAANHGDTVNFAVTGTITLTIGQLVPITDVLITGPGSGLLTISGNSARRTFAISAGRTIEIRDLKLTLGRAPSDGDPHGGCVTNFGDLHLVRVLLTDCAARTINPAALADGGDGGAIYNANGASLVLDTVSGLTNSAGKGGGNPTSPYPAGGRGGALFNAGTASIVNSTFSGNRAGDGGAVAGVGGAGGGIFSSGTLLVESSTLDNNASGDGGQFCAPTCITGADGKGGGIAATGVLTLNNVTLSGNRIGSTAIGTAATAGALLLSPATGLVQRLRNVTITGNTSSGAGGGLSREGAGTVRLRHVILAGNTSTGTTSEDCAGGGALLISEGQNLVGVNTSCTTVFGALDLFGTSAAPLNPLLGVLAANGGPTMTHELQLGSPARDAGAVTGCVSWNPVAGLDEPLLVDQRGEPRPRDGNGDLNPVCDIGSYEAPDLPVVFHTLTVQLLGTGGGQVTSTPPGINCPGDCTEQVLENTVVTLAQTATPPAIFLGWGGDCSGMGGCAVTMIGPKDVTARFDPPGLFADSFEGGSLAAWSGVSP